AEITALPQPPRTSQKVPKNSAAMRVPSAIASPFVSPGGRFYTRRAARRRAKSARRCVASPPRSARCKLLVVTEVAMQVWRLDPEVSPGEVGVDAAALDGMVREFEETLAAGKLFHGAQMVVYRGGKRVLDVGGGMARVRTRQPVTPDSLFVLFSAT